GPRARRSRRRERQPAGGAATPPPPPPSPEHGQRPPARCPSRSSSAAPRISQRSPPSSLAPASARARRRLMLRWHPISQAELIQEVLVGKQIVLVLAVDLREDRLVPDAELLGRADEHHLARYLGIGAQCRRDQHPPLRIDLDVLCRPDVPALERVPLAAEPSLGAESCL